MWYARKKGIPVDDIHTVIERDDSQERIVGVFSAAKSIERWFDIDEFPLAEGAVTAEARVFDTDTVAVQLSADGLFEYLHARLSLVVAQRRVPLSFIRDNFIGGGFQNRFLWRGKGQVPVDSQDCGGLHGPRKARADQPLNMFRLRDDRSINTARLHVLDQSPLSAAASVEICLVAAHRSSY